MIAGARRPFALAVLGLSIAIAAAVALQDQWSERAWWVLAWGCIVYAAAVALTPHRPVPAAAQRAPPPPNVAVPAQPSQEFVRLTEEALRCLNNPAALARCELSSHIPATLESSHKG